MFFVTPVTNYFRLNQYSACQFVTKLSSRNRGRGGQLRRNYRSFTSFGMTRGRGCRGLSLDVYPLKVYPLAS